MRPVARRGDLREPGSAATQRSCCWGFCRLIPKRRVTGVEPVAGSATFFVFVPLVFDIVEKRKGCAGGGAKSVSFECASEGMSIPTDDNRTMPGSLPVDPEREKPARLI